MTESINPHPHPTHTPHPPPPPQEQERGFAHAAIVTFETIRVATAFQNIPLQQHIRFMKVAAAPARNDVLWDNLGEPCESPSPLFSPPCPCQCTHCTKGHTRPSCLLTLSPTHIPIHTRQP